MNNVKSIANPKAREIAAAEFMIRMFEKYGHLVTNAVELKVDPEVKAEEISYHEEWEER